MKDTVHKQSLLYHLCCMVMEKFPNSSDFYSDLGALHRSSRVMWMFSPSNIIVYYLEIKCNDSLQNHEFCQQVKSLEIMLEIPSGNLFLQKRSRDRKEVNITIG